MSFTPEQITEILQIYFDNFVSQTYTGMRYVPIIGRRGESSAAWDNTAPYEPLTIVTYSNESYTSRQYVPAGVAITNTDYWVKTGAYNAQIAELQDALPIAQFDSENTVKDAIDELGSFLPASDFDNDNTVKAYIDGVADLLPSSAFDSVNTVRGALNGRVRAFETVADMAAATDLVADMICHTNGFYTYGDGGAAFYEIKSTGTANAMDIIACQDSLKAHLVITEPFVTPEQFGAYGDGTHDDTSALQQAINKNGKIELSGKYKISNVEIKPNTEINGGEIYGISNTPCIVFDGVSTSEEFINTFKLSNIEFRNGNKYIDFSIDSNVSYSDARYVVGGIINNCKFYGSYNGTPNGSIENKASVLTKTPALKFEKTYDITISDCAFIKLEQAILLNGCDLFNIEQNRFQKCGYNYVNLHVSGHEGASNKFNHNDVLAWFNYGGVYLYETVSDIIENNYFECSTVNACCVYGYDLVNCNLINNRVDDTTQSTPIVHILPRYGLKIDTINYMRSSTTPIIKIDNDKVNVSSKYIDNSVHIDNIDLTTFDVKCNLIANIPFSVKNVSGLFGGVLSTNEWPPINNGAFIDSTNYGNWKIKVNKQAYNHTIYLYDNSSSASTVYMQVKDPSDNTLVSGNLTQANPLTFTGFFDYVCITMKTLSTVGSIVVD